MHLGSGRRVWPMDRGREEGWRFTVNVNVRGSRCGRPIRLLPAQACMQKRNTKRCRSEPKVKPPPIAVRLGQPCPSRTTAHGLRIAQVQHYLLVFVPCCLPIPCESNSTAEDTTIHYCMGADCRRRHTWPFLDGLFPTRPSGCMFVVAATELFAQKRAWSLEN